GAQWVEISEARQLVQKAWIGSDAVAMAVLLTCNAVLPALRVLADTGSKGDRTCDRRFRQLTAERVVTRFERGRSIRIWQPRWEGERNEALDTTVYALAALHGLISMRVRLNEEADAIVAAPAKGAPADPAG